MKRLILGSNSPRRQELLKGLGIDFTVDTGNYFEENFGQDVPFDEVPRLMSEGKSDGFHRPMDFFIETILKGVYLLNDSVRKDIQTKIYVRFLITQELNILDNKSIISPDGNRAFGSGTIKTYCFVMSDSIAEILYSLQLIENSSLSKANSFSWKYLQERTATTPKWDSSEEICPESECHRGNYTVIRITSSIIQFSDDI